MNVNEFAIKKNVLHLRQKDLFAQAKKITKHRAILVRVSFIIFCQSFIN